MSRRLTIVDVESAEVQILIPDKKNTEPLPREFGADLGTITRARQWLSNPHNWHEGDIFVLKWDGLVPSVSRSRAIRMIREPWNEGLPEVVVREQMRLRRGGRKDEEQDGDA